MQLKQLLVRSFDFTSKMLTSPVHFWDDVIERKATIQVFSQFYLPYVVLVAFASTIGNLLSTPEILISYSLITGLREIFVYLIHFFVLVFIINKLLSIFGGTKNKESSQLAVGFSMTPFFLITAITGLFPFLYVLNILVLYSLYIFYTGIPKLFDVPKSRTIAFSAAVILANFFIFAVLSIVSWKLLELFY